MQDSLIIFVRNLEKGKVKTRLAKVIGDDKSLEVYKYLLEYTSSIAALCKLNLFVFYSHYIHIGDVFDDNIFSKHVQEGGDLGERMLNAFKKVYDLGAKKVCIIGSDCYELQSEIIQEAFQKLNESQVVIGPSKDGGYYLLGTNELYPGLFLPKEWSTPTVLDKTLKTIEDLTLSYSKLVTLNDIDTMEDLLETNIITRLKEENDS